jgi:hypothetical protein
MADGPGFQQTETGSSSLHDEGVQTVLSGLNILTAFLSKLPLQELVRLVWIIGGYILFRPYLERGFRRLFATQEDDSDTLVGAAGDTSSPKRGPATGSANGGENVSAGITTGRDAWGSAARNRQAMILEAWKEEQARLAEEHDLDDIDPVLLED